MTAPVLVMTVSGERPGYLAETLASWRRARGVDGWRRGFLLEPGTRADECRAAIAAQAPDAAVVTNPERRGVLANPHAALSWAFDDLDAGFAVLAEEDIVVGDDVLELFDACAGAFAADDSVLAVCAFSDRLAPQPADAVGSGPFSPWVWGTWADRWHDTLRPEWFRAARSSEPGAGQGFDFGIERMLATSGRRVVVPRASRSDNIGEFGGVHALPGEFAVSRASTFAAHREPVRFSEVEDTRGVGRETPVRAATVEG
jgi:hypothetical protein